MTHSEENFICDEARWLGNEIFLLASDAGFSPEAAKEIRRITEQLAHGVFSRKETCMPLERREDVLLLRELCAKENPIIASFPNAQTPLIFDDVTRPEIPTLYFKKQFSEETFIARSVLAAAKTPAISLSEQQQVIINAGKEAGFGFALSTEQKNAVSAILKNRITIISGGPGTGKTSLLLRALIGILSGNPDTSVEIAAPTGKAAARIRESITNQISEINSENPDGLAGKEILEKIINFSPKTLHRLLTITPGKQRPSTITADVVIVDEASMISQNLMAALLTALPDKTKLVLLGDKNQLDSVQPGHVFGDFYDAEALTRSRVSLTESHRFSNKRFIGRFANSVLEGKSAETLKILSETHEAEIHIEACVNANARKQIEATLKSILPQNLQKTPPDIEPKTLLLELENSRILTPTAEGPFGKHSINAVAQKLFAHATSGEHFHGRPILITQNAFELSLSNGDIGIILRAPGSDKLYAWFLDEDGAPRQIATPLLPEHETAYAMTIHKSQGSEFSRLGIFFPKNTHAGFYSRQLLYTAITRFKETPESRFAFYFDSDSASEAVETATQSHSLLPARLK